MSRFSPDASGSNRFQVPDITLTAPNMAINGGYAFDVPLAGMTVMQNNAMSFVGANNQLSQKSVLSQYVLGGDSVDLTFARAGASVTAPSIAALDSVSRGLASTLSFMGTAHADAMATQRYTAKRSSKSCFVTTAICEAENKPDDCEELTLLRMWRDLWLAKQPAGEAMIALYYVTAPRSVRAIEQCTDKVKRNFYSDIRARFLEPALAAIKSCNYAAAFPHYLEMLLEVETLAENLKGLEHEQSHY